MDVLDKHKVKDDPTRSRDWTTIGARILEAATIASAMHLEEVSEPATLQRIAGSDRWNREMNDDGNGCR